MADDWEDWEDETFQPKLETATNGQAALTKGQAALAAAKEPDESKFAGEDEENSAPPSWEKSVPKPQQVCYRPAQHTSAWHWYGMPYCGTMTVSTGENLLSNSQALTA